MKAFWASLSGLFPFGITPSARTAPNCPIFGAEFPPPQRLAEHPLWLKALDNITAVFDFVDGSNFTGADQFSYSIQVFSTNPGDPILWQRHRTAQNLPYDTLGVRKVDGNTVYRLGSVSKILTVLAWLAEAGDLYWNVPITRFLPELSIYSGRTAMKNFDSLRETAWDDVTIGSLASQMSGIERDYGIMGEITQTPDLPASWLQPFPKLAAASLPPCGAWPLCSRREFFNGLLRMYPSYLPWQTATYSNIGFQIFAYALEALARRPFADILNDRVIKPLNLTQTYYNNAPPAVGIIPGTITDTYWGISLGDASPSGNMYSSPNDLSAIGRAILSSKLIRPALTRRWLNPFTFSADYVASVGAPWGVRRVQLAKETQPHRTLTLFTKAGTFRKYTSFITLLKEFNLGFTIMMAGNPAVTNFQGADILGAALIPAYDAVARDEADQLYGGVYVAKDADGSNLATDSWIKISTDANKPGLGVGPWIINGTNMVEMALKLQSGSIQKPLNAETRLYYTQIESKTFNGGKNQAWKAVFEDTGGPAFGQPLFSTDCGSWVGVTGVTYGSLPLDEFIFSFDASGKVVSVTNLALRSTFYKLLT